MRQIAPALSGFVGKGFNVHRGRVLLPSAAQALFTSWDLDAQCENLIGRRRRLGSRDIPTSYVTWKTWCQYGDSEGIGASHFQLYFRDDGCNPEQPVREHCSGPAVGAGSSGLNICESGWFHVPGDRLLPG